ncbi:MAG: helix-turn-helix transcriptional regulator [Anaerostipes sp.]|nr:helix-turn-helix transcriptional regulator [Anaerostipes sp.]
MQFSKKLLILRKEKGLSQEKLAEQIGVSRQAISKWELGTAIPDTENIVQISEFFRVPIEYLLLDSIDTIDDCKNQKDGKASLIVMNIFGVLLIAGAWILTYQVQAWKMKMEGSAYANSAEYLKEFPLIIVLMLGIILCLTSTYFLLKRFLSIERS